MIGTSFIWTDEKIVEGILAGQRQENLAIEAMYAKNKHVLMSLIANKSDKVYALQSADVFMEAIEAFVDNVKDGKYQIQDNVPIGAYLTSLSKNIWHKYKQAEGKREARNGLFAEDFPTEYEPDTLDTLDILANKEKWDFYLEIFEQAGPMCKEILNLSFGGDLSTKEVVEFLMNEGKYKSDQAVRNTKSKCLKRVIDLLNLSVNPLNQLTN